MHDRPSEGWLTIRYRDPRRSNDVDEEDALPPDDSGTLQPMNEIIFNAALEGLATETEASGGDVDNERSKCLAGHDDIWLSVAKAIEKKEVQRWHALMLAAPVISTKFYFSFHHEATEWVSGDFPPTTLEAIYSFLNVLNADYGGYLDGTDGEPSSRRFADLLRGNQHYNRMEFRVSFARIGVRPPRASTVARMMQALAVLAEHVWPIESLEFKGDWWTRDVALRMHELTSQLHAIPLRDRKMGLRFIQPRAGAVELLGRAALLWLAVGETAADSQPCGLKKYPRDMRAMWQSSSNAKSAIQQEGIVAAAERAASRNARVAAIVNERVREVYVKARGTIKKARDGINRKIMRQEVQAWNAVHRTTFKVTQNGATVVELIERLAAARVDYEMSMQDTVATRTHSHGQSPYIGGAAGTMPCNIRPNLPSALRHHALVMCADEDSTSALRWANGRAERDGKRGSGSRERGGEGRQNERHETHQAEEEEEEDNQPSLDAGDDTLAKMRELFYEPDMVDEEGGGNAEAEDSLSSLDDSELTEADLGDNTLAEMRQWFFETDMVHAE